MLLLLFDFLSSVFSFKIPAAFSYFSSRMILSCITALLLTVFLGPSFIKKLYALKIGQSIRSTEEVPLLAKLHEKKKDTPTMGGVLILFSMIVSLILWMDFTSVFTWVFLIVTLSLGALGAVDDYTKLRFKNSRGLRPKQKMVFQLLISGFVSLYLVFPSIHQTITPSFIKLPVAKEQIKICETPSNVKKCVNVAKTFTLSEYMSQVFVPCFKDPWFIFDGLMRFLLVAFFMFVITGSSNAVNLTDGLDGLASGCLVMVSCVLALFSFLSNHLEIARYLNILYIEGSGEIGVYMMALAGACLGFLWYNSYPASVFMGDTGSLALGGLLGVSACMLRRELILAIAGSVFVAEALSVILQVLSYRYRNKKRIFLCSPLHHHFEYAGIHECKVVVRFWIACLLCAILGIATLKFQ